MKLGILLLTIALAGCQLGAGNVPDNNTGTGPDTGAKTVNAALAGDATVTALDDPKSASEPAPLAAKAVADAAVGIAKAEPPAVMKTAAQLACEGRGDVWTKFGNHGAICQSATKDAGKSCRASTDCSGYCLSKSMTCAPVSPMLGCNDILNEAGRMLTECVN